MIHVIDGDGKGKTTASAGLAIRAAGHGFHVLFIQFLKDDSSGEVTVLKSVPEIDVVHAKVNYGFTFQMNNCQLQETAKEYDNLLDIAINSNAFMIVLDEVIHALNAGLLNQKKLIALLSKDAELILTGRDTPDWLIDRADYVSRIEKIKHPFDNGITARLGVEF